ncbi:unnamed protein product, partial [marine sediment metagenome]
MDYDGTVSKEYYSDIFYPIDGANINRLRITRVKTYLERGYHCPGISYPKAVGYTSTFRH